MFQRMYQNASLIHGDEAPAKNMTPADIDLDYFKLFFESRYEESIEDQNLPFSLILENLNLAKKGVLNVAGALLFSDSLHIRLPVFIVKCISYPLKLFFTGSEYFFPKLSGFRFRDRMS